MRHPLLPLLLSLLSVAASGRHAHADNINMTFLELQASFTKGVSTVVADVLWGMDFRGDMKLEYTAAPLAAHGQCPDAADYLTSFLTDMTT